MRFFGCSCAVLVLLFTGLARAEPRYGESGYAEPPGDVPSARTRYAPPPDDFPNPPPSYAEAPDSTLRLGVGPVLRLDGQRADGGFAAALDVGEHAAGARFSGSWIRVGSARGLSQYGGELWIDFGAGERLHPILAAGAGLARVEFAEDSGRLGAATLGIGTLRGTLDYELPIRQANARAGIDVGGALPAIRGRGAPDVNGWALVMVRVGVGF